MSVIHAPCGSALGHTDRIQKVKLWSKDRALELLCKHFSLLVDRVESGADEKLLKLLEEGRQRNANRKKDEAD